MEKRVALYLRLSQEDVDRRTGTEKDESDSIASQRLLIEQHLQQCPDLRALPRIEFCDDGFTGTSFERPQFVRMIDMAKRGQISCIVVKDLSRFGRDYLEVGDYLEHLFPFLGIRFKAVNDHYDSDSHRGRTLGLDVAFKNLVYDHYSRDLSGKVKSALRVRQKACSLVTCAPYGYRVAPEDRHRLVIDPQTAPVVRRIYREIIAGRSSTQVARALNDEGIPTPAQAKGVRRGDPARRAQWTHRTVLTLIENVKYTGAMVNHMRESRRLRDRSQRRVPRSEWIVREGAHEAIVSRAQYEAAMNAIHRRKRGARTTHDSDDRVCVCGHCGAKREKANGTVFACPSRRYHGDSPCAGVRMRKEELEAVLLEALRRQASIVRMERRRTKEAQRTPGAQLQARLQRLCAQREACARDQLGQYEAYREGALTEAAYRACREALAQEQAALDQEIARCREALAAQTDGEQADAIARLTGLSDAQLRGHLYDAVERVVLYGGKDMEIVWKFAAPDAGGKGPGGGPQEG